MLLIEIVGALVVGLIVGVLAGKRQIVVKSKDFEIQCGNVNELTRIFALLSKVK